MGAIIFTRGHTEAICKIMRLPSVCHRAIEHPGDPPYDALMHHLRAAVLRRSAAAMCVAAFALALTLSSGASAQQEYILSADDTWKPEKAVDPATPEGQLVEARKTLAAGDAERAETLATRWIERNPRHPLLPDAYLIRGDAKAAGSDEYRALFDYEYVARMFSGSDAFVTALQRELAIAKDYVAGKKRKLWGMRIASTSEEAEELLIRVQERLPGSRLAEEAGIQLADFYFDRRQMALAAVAYELFIQNYPRSSQIDKARRRLIYSNLATFKGPEFGAAGLYEARDRLRQLQRLQPAEAQRMGADALLRRIDESDAQKLLSIAQYYLDTGEPISAEFTIRRLTRRYPHSAATADALRLAPRVLEQLPESVRRRTPDYAAMSAALLSEGDPRTKDATPPETESAPATESNGS